MQASTISQEEPGLFEQANEYAQTQIKLLKYRAVDKGADVVSSVVSKLAVVLLMILFFIMLNIGLGLWIGTLLGETFYGFFSIAAFYLLIALLLGAFGKKWVKIPLTDMIIKKLLN